ncbi:hypothetical protein [Hallerella porci]|uniref:hypothetical protein n=1 Tax=Hallerella porci TaxID=1945871 RepID=UPI000D05CCEB|nr:hypothetical protein [Hallerella porci]
MEFFRVRCRYGVETELELSQRGAEREHEQQGKWQIRPLPPGLSKAQGVSPALFVFGDWVFSTAKKEPP